VTEMEERQKPDLGARFPSRELPDGGIVLGVVEGEDAILVRRGDDVFALGASCSH